MTKAKATKKTAAKTGKSAKAKAPAAKPRSAKIGEVYETAGRVAMIVVAVDAKTRRLSFLTPNGGRFRRTAIREELFFKNYKPRLIDALFGAKMPAAKTRKAKTPGKAARTPKPASAPQEAAAPAAN